MGIVAALLVQVQTQSELRAVNAQLADLQAANTALKAQAATPREAEPTVDAIAQTNGVVDALIALQNRIAVLEKGAAPATDATVTGALAPDSALAGGVPADGTMGTDLAGLPPAADAAALPAGPQNTGPLQSATAAEGEECIPVGTQFIVGTGDNYAVCGTGQSVKVTAVSDQQIVLAQGGAIAAGGDGPFGDKCRVTVNSINDGFARLRVTCT